MAHAVGFQIAAAVLGQSLLPELVGVMARRLGLKVVAPALLIEETQLQINRRAHARARHRRCHVDLLRRAISPAGAIAVSYKQAAGALDERAHAGWWVAVDTLRIEYLGTNLGQKLSQSGSFRFISVL
jgi:hypothetical protein